jgi:AcrR family transcriptional regulator
VAVPGGRGATRETAILRATLELLGESGYDQMTIDAVAARARCSKATIYRRWPDKAALVVTAVRRHAGQPAAATAPDTGSLRSDPQAALKAMRSSLSGQDAAWWARIVQQPVTGCVAGGIWARRDHMRWPAYISDCSVMVAV